MDAWKLLFILQLTRNHWSIKVKNNFYIILRENAISFGSWRGRPPPLKKGQDPLITLSTFTLIALHQSSQGLNTLSDWLRNIPKFATASVFGWEIFLNLQTFSQQENNFASA